MRKFEQQSRNILSRKFMHHNHAQTFVRPSFWHELHHYNQQYVAENYMINSVFSKIGKKLQFLCTSVGCNCARFNYKQKLLHLNVPHLTANCLVNNKRGKAISSETSPIFTSIIGWWSCNHITVYSIEYANCFVVFHFFMLCYHFARIRLMCVPICFKAFIH